MPEPGEKWYMAGTDGSGEYIVVADGEYGRIGYREIKPEVYRIRFEPNTDDSEVVAKIHGVLKNWCPPQAKFGGDTFRFSILGNGKNALRCGVDMGIKALGSFGSFNPEAPEFLRKLIDEPFDESKTPVGFPIQKDGFWIGKKSTTGDASGMFGSWLTMKKMAPLTTSFEEEHEDEDEDEEYESDEGSDEEEDTPPPPTDEIHEDYEEHLMKWMKDDVPLGDGYTITIAPKKMGQAAVKAPLTSALKNICLGEGKKGGQSWNLGCDCSYCIKANSNAIKVYEQAKLDYAAKVEAEKPLTEEQIKEQALAQAATMAKAATDLAAALKAFGF